MADNEDIERLVKRLKDLQLEQAEIIRRLEEAGRKQTRSSALRLSPGDRVQIVTKVTPPEGIRPSSRDTTGRIVSITPKRVKVKTDSGITTFRAPHNVKRIQG